MKNEKIVVDSCVSEILQNAGRGRYSGVVSKIDGSTSFIKSGEREFLAWTSPHLIVGTPVEFSIDQFRATRIIVTPTPPVPDTDTKQESQLRPVEPVIEEDKLLNAMQLAWRRRNEDVAAKN